MEAILAAAGAAFSPAILAVFGPTTAILLFMAWMLWTYYRGREERLARLNDEMTRSLREDQRALFQQQSDQLQSLRVDIETVTSRLRATERLAARQRSQIFDLYELCRENTHAAANARQLLISAGIKSLEEFPPLVWPAVPATE